MSSSQIPSSVNLFYLRDSAIVPPICPLAALFVIFFIVLDRSASFVNLSTFLKPWQLPLFYKIQTGAPVLTRFLSQQWTFNTAPSLLLATTPSATFFSFSLRLACIHPWCLCCVNSHSCIFYSLQGIHISPITHHC